jgi:multicomponent Na+:H+ antiporter subunit E
VSRGLGRLAFLTWLVAVWVALWGDLTVANVVGGVLVGGVLLLVFPDAGPRQPRYLDPLAALRFLGYFAVRLVEATALVAWEVLTPRPWRLNEAVVAVPIYGASDAVVTLIANAISLTPGTLTLEVRRGPEAATLYVHMLHFRSVEQVRREVEELEVRALRAFCAPPVLRDAAGIITLPSRDGGRSREGM